MPAKRGSRLAAKCGGFRSLYSSFRLTAVGNSTRNDYWASKIDENRRRDERQVELLQAAGWAVVRLWQHEHPGDAATRMAALVQERSLT